MKIINCYLKYQTTDLPVSLQPVEKSLRQTCYYKLTLKSQHQLLEDRKHRSQRKRIFYLASFLRHIK